MAMPTSLFSSSSANQWTYDVFLSFRGMDTRNNFTGHLYNALHEKGIKTFMDDEKLRKGEEITPALIKAIRESWIAIVVFSENFASSSFCLDELVIIMECLKPQGNPILPIFYKVDPSYVRHQIGSFGEALAKHETRISEKGKVQKWRSALEKAGNLSGWHFTKEGNRQEYKFIQSIVEEVSKRIHHSTSCIADYPVGSGSFEQKSKAISPFMHETSVQPSGLQTSPSASSFRAQSPSGLGYGAQSSLGLGTITQSSSGLGYGAQSSLGLGTIAPSSSTLGYGARSSLGLGTITQSSSGLGYGAQSSLGLGTITPSSSTLGYGARSSLGLGTITQSSGLGTITQSSSGLGYGAQSSLGLDTITPSSSTLGSIPQSSSPVMHGTSVQLSGFQTSPSTSGFRAQSSSSLGYGDLTIKTQMAMTLPSTPSNQFAYSECFTLSSTNKRNPGPQ